MMTILVLAVLAVSTEALPYRLPGKASHYGHPGTVGSGFGPRGAHSAALSGNTEEVNRWLRLVKPISTAPSNYIQDRPGPSIYDDYNPQPNLQALSTRTLWFDEFPHRRAVLNWQEKRIQQGLPIYKLLSQRPGFPFYQGN